MWFSKSLIAFCAGTLSLCISIAAQADTTVVEKHVIVTPPPKSETCTTVPGHWEGDVWYDTQTVCKYSNRAEGSAWVEDYWTCTVFNADGNCTAWNYQPGHWVKTFP